MITPGTKLGHYEIEGSIGAGGMGEVYRARDVRLDRTVAIKVLPSHLSENQDLRDRFDREARTISNLQHPNICALHDVGHENGVDFLVMEYLQGETLAERLMKGPLPANDLLPVAAQIASALDAAHKNGVVHRDLKPGNVILTRAGAKLLDFGLAKIAGGTGGGIPDSSSSFTQLATGVPESAPLTEKGTILGTFQYMAPEQLEGKEADVRSDIFSFGALLYEGATGRKAFTGDSQASLIVSIMTSQPQSITTIQPMTPPALDRLIRTCLEKDPENRWQTAHDVALQLKGIQEGGSELGVPKPVAAKRKSNARAGWIVAALASIAALAMAAIHFLAPAPPEPYAIRSMILIPETITSIGSPRISPDGRYIAFNGNHGIGESQIWVRPLEGDEAYPLPGTDGARRPFWSPDSRFIGFFADGKLKRIPVAGGPPLTLCEFARGADGAWGDGWILFDGTTGDSLMAVPDAGGAIRGASVLDRERGSTGDGWPFFLPDGEQFVYIKLYEEANEIHLGRIGSTETKLLTLGESRLEYVDPGYLIYERNGTLLAHPFDAKRGELTGDPFALAEGIGTGGRGLAHFSGSANGILIFAQDVSSDQKILRVDRAGRVLDSFGEPGIYMSPALSPDGRRLAYEHPLSTNTSLRDIWIMDLDRNVSSRFTFGEANFGAVWSPDGTEIAFCRSVNGDASLYRKNTSGTGEARLIRTVNKFMVPCEWPEADMLTVSTNETQNENPFDIGYISASESADTTIHYWTTGPFVDALPALAPDRRFVAYISLEAGRPEVFLLSLQQGGGKWQISTNGGSEPRWNPDGSEIFYLGQDGSLYAVPVDLADRVQIGAPLALFEAPVQRTSTARNRYVPALDGQSFYCMAPIEAERVPPINMIVNWTAGLAKR